MTFHRLCFTFVRRCTVVKNMFLSKEEARVVQFSIIILKGLFRKWHRSIFEKVRIIMNILQFVLFI